MVLRKMVASPYRRLNEKAVAETAGGPIASPESEAGMGVIVMVVEDDPALQRLLGSTLAASGLKAILLNNAEDALERLPDEHPDVIICDVNLPGMNGTELVEMVRASDLADTPVILMSAYGEPREHSADVYVGKPFEPFELAQLVERLSSSA